MAQQVITQYTCDLTGTPADETVSMSLDGVDYSIDLCANEADGLRTAVALYVERARRLGGRKTTGKLGHVGAAKVSTRPPTMSTRPATVDRDQNKAVRDWANRNGFKLSRKGRIPKEVMEKFQESRGLTFKAVPEVEPEPDEVDAIEIRDQAYHRETRAGRDVVRAYAREAGLKCSDKAKIPEAVYDAFFLKHDMK